MGSFIGGSAPSAPPPPPPVQPKPVVRPAPVVKAQSEDPKKKAMRKVRTGASAQRLPQSVLGGVDTGTQTLLGS